MQSTAAVVNIPAPFIGAIPNMRVLIQGMYGAILSAANTPCGPFISMFQNGTNRAHGFLASEGTALAGSFWTPEGILCDPNATLGIEFIFKFRASSNLNVVYDLVPQ